MGTDAARRLDERIPLARVRVLLVEDCVNDAQLILDALGPGTGAGDPVMATRWVHAW